MAYRSDITFNWISSPRIITVESPSVELTMQDLVDTVREHEDDLANMDSKKLLDATGKQNLGGGVKVGITVQMLNALVGFEARSGPDYIQCNVSGGNLVALDIDGFSVSPISPTAFTQIVLANSSSATLSEQSAIEFGSFNGGVTYDETSPYAGTDFPTGTPQQPVNNVYDAKLIATERGFTTGYIIGDMNVPEDLEILGFSFIGSGKDRTDIIISDAAEVSECTYVDAHVQGYLDGNNTLYDCLIDDLHYIKGYIESCVLAPGIITLGGNDTAHFLDCFSGVPGTGTPTIDMGGSGQPLALRNYNGGIKLQNKNGPESVSIDMNSGQIKIDMTTVTNGTIVCRGVGKLIEATTGEHIHSGVYGNLILYNELVNNPAIIHGVWNEDLSDHQVDGSAGDVLSSVPEDIWTYERP